MQTKALKLIRRWISISIMISAIGILFCYCGFIYSFSTIIYKAVGIILLIIGVILTLVLGFDYRNGSKNVKKMIDVLEKKLKDD